MHRFRRMHEAIELALIAFAHRLNGLLVGTSSAV
jgi:hypothetical protein